MANPIFTEKQKFTQWWIWIIIIAGALGSTAAFYASDQLRADAWPSLLLTYGVLVLVIIFLKSMTLKSRIDEKGVHYSFWPLIWKEKTIPWTAIEKAEVIKYSPIQDYGGWGYRYTFGSKGKALNVKGNMGLKLYFSDKKPLLIGTQKAAELEAVVEKYSSPKHD